MSDFSSALYLGMRHPSPALPRWSSLTLGKPAALAALSGTASLCRRLAMLQGWTDTSVMHFRNLALFGEQLLLSIRYGNWSDIYEPTQAFNWARFWRPQAQGYIHAYRAATGVHISADAPDLVGDATMPSILLRQRLNKQLRSA